MKHLNGLLFPAVVEKGEGRGGEGGKGRREERMGGGEGGRGLKNRRFRRTNSFM